MDLCSCPITSAVAVFVGSKSQSTSKDPAGDPTETPMDVGLLDGRPAEAAGDGSPLALWCGRLTGFVLFILATCVVVLEPNQYGILAATKSLQATRNWVHSR